MDSIEQKANELVDRYNNTVASTFYGEVAIRCAIICVDEIISNAENYTEWSLEEFKLTMQYEFWQKVKERLLAKQ